MIIVTYTKLMQIICVNTKTWCIIKKKKNINFSIARFKN